MITLSSHKGIYGLDQDCWRRLSCRFRRV